MPHITPILKKTIFVVLVLGAVSLFWTLSFTQNILDGPRRNWILYFNPDKRTSVNSSLFGAEKRFPIVRKKPDPKPPFQTGVYGLFDTSNYTNEEGTIFIPAENVLQSMTLDETQEVYFRYIENIQVRCPRMRHIGDDNDGGYHICEPAIPNACLAYSFGSRKEYSFDDGLVAHYGCEVHTFDPGDGQPDHQHSELVTFHKLGLGGEDTVNSKKWTMKTLSSIRNMLGHQDRPLDVLKIDIEGGEWEALPQILQEHVLDHAHVKLLIIEFHMHINTKKDKNAFMFALKILQRIYNARFRIYFFRIWAAGGLHGKYKRAFADEVHFVRI